MEETGISEIPVLPAEMLAMIFSHLAISDKTNVRKACKTFRDLVDAQIHHRVTLNNCTCETVKAFSPRLGIHTLVVEAFNKRLKSTSSSRFLVAKKDVKELVLAGRSCYAKVKENTSLRPFNYPYLPNETHFYRHFEHWMSIADLTMGISNVHLKYIIQFTNETVTELVISTDVFMDCDHAARMFRSDFFPNLKSLEVTVVHSAKPETKQRLNAALGVIFDMRFSHLQRISFVSLCGCNDITKQSWCKFYKFVVAHSGSLYELGIVSHSHFDLMKDKDSDMEVKALSEGMKSLKLKRMSLVLLNTMNVREQYKSVYHRSFEIELLKCQTKIQVLKLDFGFLFANGIFSILPKYEDLRACSIHIYCTLSRLELVDLGFLKLSKQLQVLQIVCDQDTKGQSPWMLSGINHISPSIEHLSLSADLSVNDACWIHEYFLNLKNIRYHGGIRRDRGDSMLTPERVELINHVHFYNCVNRMPNLKTFRLAQPNNLISNSVLHLNKKVDFEIRESFISSFHIPFHIQH